MNILLLVFSFLYYIYTNNSKYFIGIEIITLFKLYRIKIIYILITYLSFIEFIERNI